MVLRALKEIYHEKNDLRIIEFNLEMNLILLSN